MDHILLPQHLFLLPVQASAGLMPSAHCSVCKEHLLSFVYKCTLAASVYLSPVQASAGLMPSAQLSQLMVPLVRSLFGPGPTGQQPGAQERVQLRECLRYG